MPVTLHDLAGGPLAALERSVLLARLDARERDRLLACAEVVEIPAGERAHGDADAGTYVYIVLKGTATLRRTELEERHLGPGDTFGELALLGGVHRGEAVIADSTLTAARISGACWEEMERSDPVLAARLAAGLAAILGEELARLSGDMGLLLRGRSLPRAPEVTVRVAGVERRVRTGTRVQSLLPAEIDGDLVVAGLLGQKPVSLAAPVFTDTGVTPLTVRHWEGRQIYAQSVGLVLLEAAHQVAPDLRVRMGPSRGTHQVVEVQGHVPDRAGLAARISEAMARIAASDAALRLEFWATDEAAGWFRDRGWDDAALLLRIRRQATVRLVSCGGVYALSMGPLLPSAGAVRGFRLSPGDEGLALELGPRDPRNGGGNHPRPSPRPPRDGDMVRDHQRWLA